MAGVGRMIGSLAGSVTEGTSNKFYVVGWDDQQNIGFTAYGRIGHSATSVDLMDAADARKRMKAKAKKYTGSFAVSDDLVEQINIRLHNTVGFDKWRIAYDISMNSFVLYEGGGSGSAGTAVEPKADYDLSMLGDW
jgi:hypothetical protein